MTRSLLCLALGLGACSPAPPTTPPAPAAGAAPGAAPAVASAPATTAPAPTPGGENALAPLLVTMTASRVDGGDTELLLSLDVRRPLPFPLTVTATPPAGASLVAGALLESIPAPAPGVLRRTFRVRGDLSAASPVRLVVHGAAADGSSGVHADRRFPEEAPAPAVSSPPPPPGGRPPGRPPGPVRPPGSPPDRAWK